MIVPMKKASILVLESDRLTALDALGSLGLVHLESGEAGSEELQALLAKKAEFERAANTLGTFAKSAKAGELGSEGAEDGVKADEIRGEVLAANEERKLLLDLLFQDTKEKARLAPWGSFDLDDFAAIEGKGIGLSPFEYSAKFEGELPETLQWIEVNRDSKTIRCLIVGEPPAGLPPWLLPFALPVMSSVAIEERIRLSKRKLDEIDAKLLELSRARPMLESAVREYAERIDFEMARLGMESTGAGILVLNGFVPVKDCERLKKEAGANGWAILVDDPAPTDFVPTLVKNNAIVRMIHPILDFLKILPGYREYEINAWFLMFLTVFVGMIIGDGGYGLIFLSAGIALAVRALRKGSKVPDFVRLLLTLSSSTIVWGALTGTWFGIDLSLLPVFLQSLTIPALADPDPKISQMNIKIICFVLGAGQLSIAHIKNIKKEFPGLKFIGQIGMLSLVFGLFFFVLNMVVDKARFPIPFFAPYCAIGGFALFFVFGNQEGNFWQGLLTSLKNFLPTFLGGIGCFADIISYVRLFALGIAGLAISQTINGMIMNIPPGIPRILFGLILALMGHGLNLVLSVLSVIVHGIRLNVLEFSGHLGLEWSGIKYSPFSSRMARNGK